MPSSVMNHVPDQFNIMAQKGADVGSLMRMDAYSAATAFVRGDFSVGGDISAAIRYFVRQPHSATRQRLLSLFARLSQLAIASQLGGRKTAARNISFHYDLSNDFYRLFLDARMQYEAGHFTSPESSLEDAQLEKLACDMRRAADAGGAKWDSVWLFLRERDELLHGFRGEGGMRNEDQRRIADRSHRREIGHHVDREIREDMRVDDERAVEAQHQRVSVGRGLRDLLRADIP